MDITTRLSTGRRVHHNSDFTGQILIQPNPEQITEDGVFADPGDAVAVEFTELAEIIDQARHHRVTLDLETATIFLGAAWHTALRQASDHPQAVAAYRAIHALVRDEEWRNILITVIEELAAVGVHLVQDQRTP